LYQVKQSYLVVILMLARQKHFIVTLTTSFYEINISNEKGEGTRSFIMNLNGKS